MPDHDHIEPDPRSRIGHVGVYRRRLPVSLERMYENALDWEHLPHLHRSSFSAIECLNAGPWGWRARATSERGSCSVIELALDRPLRRWITRTLEGARAGAEVWTHAFEVGPRRVDINVDFFVPGVAPERRAEVGRAYGRLYERLYDEDVAMMSERQHRLDRRVDPIDRHSGPVDLGPEDGIDVPVTVPAFGREYRLDRAGTRLVAYGTVCPHQLGPLDGPIEDGIVRCPWHGYAFDVTSGTCVSGSRCRLPPAPEVVRRNGRILLLPPG